MKTAVIVDYDVLSPYGSGTQALWQGMIGGQTAIRACPFFRADTFRSGQAAWIDSLDPDPQRVRILHMLETLITTRSPSLPAETSLLVATTNGAIDRLEQAVLSGKHPPSDPWDTLLAEVGGIMGIHGPATVLSAACASSTAALTRALLMIRRGCDAVMIAALDGLSEFLFSGFSSLMALDEQVARPFDRDRAGLSLGEAAAWMLVMDADRARRDGYPIKATLQGGAMTNDANHMTGPSRDGAGLAKAIRQALNDAAIEPSAIAQIAAHGTGTRYNDAMEIKALRTVFDSPKPTYSIKGGTGHTMGSAGLLQTIVALEATRQGRIPATLGTQVVDDEAAGWVATTPQSLDGHSALIVNAGFGGINAAVVINGRISPEATP